MQLKYDSLSMDYVNGYFQFDIIVVCMEQNTIKLNKHQTRKKKEIVKVKN